MKSRCDLSMAAVVGWMALMLTSPALAQFEELLGHLPESANAIVLVNIKKLLDSPMARQEGWREDPTKLFAAGLISIPAGVDQLVLAAQVDFRSMHPVWEVALVGMGSTPTLPAIAKQYGGLADTVAGAPALRLPDDTYLVRFSDTCLGGFTPGNRQAVAQWVRGSGQRVSPYLQEATTYAHAGTEIIMALDMTDVAALSDVHQAIATVGDASGSSGKADLKALAGLLQGARGVMLGVKFNKNAFGKIKLDLAADASPLSGIAKPLFLAMVARRGVMIDEFQNWKVAVENHRVMFGGYLNSSGLTRLSSMLDLPTPALCTLHEAQLSFDRQQTAAKTPTDATAKTPSQIPSAGGSGPGGTNPSGVAGAGQTIPSTPPAQAPKAPVRNPTATASPGNVPSVPVSPGMEGYPGYVPPSVEATQRYFHATGHLIRDVRNEQRDSRTFGQVAQWYANYARKIDRLPLLRVDDQMLDYGGYVSTEFRKASAAIKESNIRAHAEEVTAVNQGVNMTVNTTTISRRRVVSQEATFTREMTLPERRAVRRVVRAQENAAGMGSAAEIQLKIDAATAEIRGLMTKKYQHEF